MRRIALPLFAAQKELGMIKWILKRTLLSCASALGGAFVVFLGLMMLFGGIIGESTPAIVVGIILGLVGIFLLTFSRALGKWIEIK